MIMSECQFESIILVPYRSLMAYYILCRGENGELRLGIRRAIRPRNGLPESIVGNQSCYPNFLSSVANAISAKSMFHVFYSPRY